MDGKLVMLDDDELVGLFGFGPQKQPVPAFDPTKKKLWVTSTTRRGFNTHKTSSRILLALLRVCIGCTSVSIESLPFLVLTY